MNVVWVDTIEKLKDFWYGLNLRDFILFSFGLQCILIFGSSLRIQTSRPWVHRVIWLAYLLADWVAYYAIGLTVTVNRRQDKYTSNIHAFWAPFLLLHIGGPNSIVGFSLVDNELWDRSVLRIIVQAGATGIAIYHGLSKRDLLAPTLLVFIVAFSRYVGRILALYTGSIDNLRNSVIHERLENKYYSRDHPADSDSIWVPITPRQLGAFATVADAYESFTMYKGIFCSLSIKINREIGVIRERLRLLHPYQIFTETEIQLSLAYDLFYTKIWTIVESKAGRLLHLVSLSSELGALVLWGFVNKNGYHKLDIQITNTLLIGGVVVDAASTLKLLCSDLVIYHLSKFFLKFPSLDCTFKKLLFAKKPDRGKRFALFRRWSGSIKQFNGMLYVECHSQCVVKLLSPITGHQIGVSTLKLSDGLKNYIATGIKFRAYILNGRRPWVGPESMYLGEYTLEMYDKRELLANAMQMISRCSDMVDALLVCHIATHYFYLNGKVEEQIDQNEGNIRFRDVNIQISEYLMYLLFHQPKTILEGAGIIDRTAKYMMKELQQIKPRLQIDNDPSLTDFAIGRNDESDYSSEEQYRREEDELKNQLDRFFNILKHVEEDRLEERRCALISKLVLKGFLV